jgi:hypothetical protein
VVMRWVVTTRYIKIWLFSGCFLLSEALILLNTTSDMPVHLIQSNLGPLEASSHHPDEFFNWQCLLKSPEFFFENWSRPDFIRTNLGNFENFVRT